MFLFHVQPSKQKRWSVWRRVSINGSFVRYSGNSGYALLLKGVPPCKTTFYLASCTNVIARSGVMQLFHVMSFPLSFLAEFICSDDIRTSKIETLNALRSWDAHIHKWTVSSLLQVMTCRIFGTMPLPTPMMTCHQFLPEAKISAAIRSKFANCRPGKCIWKCCL